MNIAVHRHLLPAWVGEPPAADTWRYVIHNEHGELMVIDFRSPDFSLRITSSETKGETFFVSGLKGTKLSEFKKRLQASQVLGMTVVVPDAPSTFDNSKHALVLSPTEVLFVLAILSVVAEGG